MKFFFLKKFLVMDIQLFAEEMTSTRVIQFFFKKILTTQNDAQSCTDQRLLKPFLHWLRKKSFTECLKLLHK